MVLFISLCFTIYYYFEYYHDNGMVMSTKVMTK